MSRFVDGLKKGEIKATDIVEVVKRSFTFETVVPCGDGFSIDLIEVAIFIVIFAGFLLLGRLLYRQLRRLLMHLQVKEDRQPRVLGGAYLIEGLIGFIVALYALGAPRESMQRLFSYSIPIGETRLGMTGIAVTMSVVGASVVLAKCIKVSLRDRVLPVFQLPVHTEFLAETAKYLA